MKLIIIRANSRACDTGAAEDRPDLKFLVGAWQHPPDPPKKKRRKKLNGASVFSQAQFMTS